MALRFIGVILVFAVFTVIALAAYWVDSDTMEQAVGPEWREPAPLLVAVASGLCALFFSALLLGVGRRAGPRTIIVPQAAAPVVYARPPAAPAVEGDLIDRLAKAKHMLDTGVIDFAEFEALKANLLKTG